MKGTSGIGTAAAATSAAIFGPAFADSADQPALSRILTKLTSLPLSAAISRNSGASCVQPIVIGAPDAISERTRSSSARQSWRPLTMSAPRHPRSNAAAASGIVSSHEQMRSVRRSGIGFLVRREAPLGRPRTDAILFIDLTKAIIKMRRERDSRIRRPNARTLDLPPPFRLVMLREVGDAFVHACAHAAELGAGKPVIVEWPDAIYVDRGLIGGGRLGWPDHADERAPPDWLVFGAAIRTMSLSREESGLHPLSTALGDENFGDISSERLVEGFARHLMVAVDRWQEGGLTPIAKEYIAKLKPESGARCEIGENGDLVVRRPGEVIECRKFLPALR